MGYIGALLLGMCGGAFCVYMLLDGMRTALRQQKLEQQSFAEQLASKRVEIQEAHARWKHETERLKSERKQFDGQVITYTDLQGENSILKQDLRNVDIHLRKLQLDTEMQRRCQVALDERGRELGARYLKENIKWITASLNPNNFASGKQRLQDVIERCRGIGFEIPSDQEAALHAELRQQYEKIVRAAFEREEQVRIKALIREEQLREKEIDRELKQLDREREAIKAALERALAEAHDQHSEEVERLRARLSEAEAKSARAISQAQLTKAGFVYVISNIGSFGEGVFKVGLTRRLEPMDRVRELGGASVPFPFDVHMMISCDDAPALEYALHRRLHKYRINKTNPRKEFFKTDFEVIYEVVSEFHGEVEYVADAEALQYRQTLEMSEEDQEFIENVYDALEEENVGEDED